MAEIKGIDVSRWNGNIDWKTVAEYGMGCAILRITEKGNVIDGTFEQNYKGCIDYKIPVGVYKYSYATTIEQIKEEANVVVKTLNKRKLDYPVFLDIEDECQANLSADLMMNMIDAFKDAVVKAGYKFGIYCGYYWYQTKLPEGAKKYDCWLAAYPTNDNGTLQERLRPSEGIAWQYSSKSTIPGIPTKVDRNVFYKDYTKENEDRAEEHTDNICLSKQDAINKLISIAESEIGYLEKKFNASLDDKTVNAGNGNYTKYWRDIKPEYQAQPWCAAYVSWCFMKAFGLETAKKMLKHWPYVYCPTLGNLFTKHANPEVGDIVIFYRNGTFVHTCIVTKVDGDRFETIEGNTSGASAIVDNGGGVCRKSYLNSQLPGTKFCRPDYSLVSYSTSSTPSTPTKKSYLSLGDVGSEVKSLQQKLNKLGFTDANGNKLNEDSEFGSCTLFATKTAQAKYNLEVDGKCGALTMAAIDKAITALSNNNTVSNLVGQAQAHLRNLVDAELPITNKLDSRTKLALRKAIQFGINCDYKANLKIDGVIGSASKAQFKKVALKQGNVGILVTAIEIAMMSNGYDPKGVENPGKFGECLSNAVYSYQVSHNLSADKIVGYNTLMELCK